MSKREHSINNKGLSLILITVFVLSSLTAATQLASAQGGTPSSTYNVTWKKESPTSSNNWTWTNIQWIYGPTISLNVTYANGTPLIDPSGGMPSHYLVPGEQFCVNITVPKSLIELGRNVSTISFNMNKYNSYCLPNGTTIGGWSASISMSYTAYAMSYGGYGGYKPTDPWNFYSSFFNYTYTPGGSAGNATGSGGGGVGSGLPPRYEPPPAIFIPNRAACRFTETDERYSVLFQGKLNSSTSIKGTFWCYYWVQDTKGSSINTTNQSGNIVVIEPDQTYWYGTGWASYAVDVRGLNNKPIQTVAPGSEFKITVEVTGTTSVGYVNVSLPTPVDWNWWWDTTNKNIHHLQHYQQWNTTEAWNTYWNGTAYEWRKGSQEWVWNGTGYSYVWHPWSVIEGERRIRLTCDVAHNMFSIDEGFEYTFYNGPSYSNWTSWFGVNKTGSSNFYNLYSTSANITALSDGKKIDFGIDIMTNASAPGDYYYFNVKASKTDGSEIYGWGNTYLKILGANVVRTKLMKAAGDKPILKITPDKSFKAVMEITGKPEFIDAVMYHTTNITYHFTSSSDYSWGTVGDWDYWNSTYLEFYVINDTISGTNIIEVFNCTSSGQFNDATYESFYNWNRVKVLDPTQYILLNSFTIDKSPEQVLTLTFNLTFKSGVPEGYYSWEGYLANRTYYWWDPTNYWYNYYEWSSDESLDYTELRIPDSWSILVGNAESYWYYSWATQAWGVDSTSGALDLDNSNVTKDDQFYVKMLYNSTSYWTQGGDMMTVNLNWGQYNMWSYFALMNYTWSYEWNQFYIWYYPGNMSTVRPDTLAMINSTVWDTEDNAVVPEYAQISYYTINKTWDKIQAEYSEYGWWQPEYSWTWLEINFNQNFWAPTQQGPHSYAGSSSNLFFQYAGMLLFKDANDNGVVNMGFSGGSADAQELTHYFMFENAEGIDLTTPFAGDSGSQDVSVNDEVSWGVSVNDMNGTTYPTQVAGHSGFAGLGWWWYDCFGMGYTPTGNFSTVPSKVGVDSLNFTAHFSIPDADLTAGAVNEVRLKIDEGVGAWTLYEQPQNELLNYSMALAFLASSSNWQYSFKTSNGTSVDSDDDSMTSDMYNITSSGGVKLANIQMGGANYTWGKDGQNYAMHSSTTPMAAYTAMYSSYSMSGSGSASICSFSMTGENYYVTSSFKNWDGYSVETDPYFAVYTSQPGGGTTTGGGGFGGVMLPILVIAAVSLVVVVVVVLVVKRKRQY